VIDEFNSYTNTIRLSCASYAKRREVMQTEYKMALAEKERNIEELAKTAREIANLS
jgi:predicted MarR family transcription regulator